MDGESNKPNPISRLLDSINRKFSLEEPPIKTTIYRYPKSGEQEVWIEKVTKETPFNPFEYSLGTIPASNTIYTIHFLPPEATEVLEREQEDGEPWFYDTGLAGKKVSVSKKGLNGFVDLLNFIKSGGMKDEEYIMGKTNYIMANAALRLGFHRCWEQGLNPPDLNYPMNNDQVEYMVCVSVKELVERYDLKNKEASLKSVIDVIRSNGSKVS